MGQTRKRQTRISFDPLPPSSPASAGYHQHIRDRAASVRYEGAPAKRRKVRDAPVASSLGAGPSSEPSVKSQVNKESFPPTPDPTANTQTSLGAGAVSEDSDSGPTVNSTRRMSRHKKPAKQKKLEFDLTPVSPKNQAINTSQPVKAGFFGSQKTQPTLIDSSEGESSGQDSSPGLSSLKRRDKKKKLKSKLASPEPVSVPQPKAAVDDLIQLDESEEEEEMPTTPAAKSRALKRKRQSRESSSPSLDKLEEDEDSDIVVTGSRKRIESAKKRAIPEPEEESEEEPPSRSRKRLRRGKSSQMSAIAEEERQDLEDDLVDLASSGSDTEVRLRQKSKLTKKSARELALAQLKRKRGNPTVDAGDTEQQAEGESRSPSGNQDYYEESLDEEDDDDDEDEMEPPRTTRRQMFTQTEDDEGFVIEDDGPLGVPTGVPEGVPIAFTRYASMKARELFKFAIEWMVQKKINPAFQMDDEIYRLTFQKLNDEVTGLAGSKFTSAAWTQKFTLALQARPEIVYDRIDRQSAAHFMRDKCDACNRSGHPATYEVRFEGKPYHKETLEPVAPMKESQSDSDSNSSSSSESSVDEGVAVNRDAQDRKILPQETVFYLGKFCMSNAQTSHSLQHWRYHLYEWVVEYLEHAGYNTPALIVKRDKWSTRKRRKYANKIVDTMQEEGKIKALYNDFKTEIDTARNSKQGRWDSSP